MKMTGIYAIMKNNLTPQQIKELTVKYNLSTSVKKFTTGGTINDFAKDFFQDERYCTTISIYKLRFKRRHTLNYYFIIIGFHSVWRFVTLFLTRISINNNIYRI